jgi:hypothetical protein
MTPGPLLLLASALTLAQPASTPPADRTPELAPVVVSGVQPGPRLWKATRDGHVLWILGTLSPVPRDIEWQSREVGQVLDGAGTVLLGARASVSADVGLLRGLMLVPQALKARRNPDGRTLREVLPPDLYARWQPLKARYLRGDDDVERWRPLFAAEALYAAAIKRQGLTDQSPVAGTVARLARKRDVPTATAEVKATVRAKAMLQQLAASPLDDTACFARTLDRLETDLANMTARANAWAVGDLATLRALPYEDQGPACLAAVLASAMAREQHLDDLPARVRTAWVDAAEAALAGHDASLALLPMAEILKPDGYLAALQARGVAVEAPAGTDASPAQ